MPCWFSWTSYANEYGSGACKVDWHGVLDALTPYATRLVAMFVSPRPLSGALAPLCHNSLCMADSSSTTRAPSIAALFEVFTQLPRDCWSDGRNPLVALRPVLEPSICTPCIRVCTCVCVVGPLIYEPTFVPDALSITSFWAEIAAIPQRATTPSRCHVELFLHSYQRRSPQSGQV